MKAIQAILCPSIFVLAAGLVRALAGSDALPEDRGAAGLWQALKRARTTASALHLTAHPDDEDAGTMCLLARGQGARTMLLSLTRGEGGANLISSHFFDELGLLRTLELLRADRYYGVEQFFTRAADYGFSKTVEEARRSWDEEEILRDVVRVIRRERPDVIFARFRGDDRDGHGHHTLSGVIAREAFAAAADPLRFPEQIAEGLSPWQAKKLYHGNVAPERRPEDKDAATLTVDPGQYDPYLGRSYHQIAREGYSYHRSQGMMSPPSIGGSRPSRYRLLKSRVHATLPEREESFFDGIDTSIAGLANRLDGGGSPELKEGLKAVERHLAEALAAFDPDAPERTVEPLARAYSELVALSYPHPELRDQVGRKLSEVQKAIILALGIEVDARAGAGRGPGERFDHVIPGQTFTAQVTVVNRGRLPVKVFLSGVPAGGYALGGLVELRRLGGVVTWRTLGPNESVASPFEVQVPGNALATRPHWVRDSIKEHLYRWTDLRATYPLPPSPFEAVVLLSLPLNLWVYEPIRVPVEEPKRGVRMDPLTIVPAISIRFAAAHGVVPAGKRVHRLAVLVHSNGKGPANGTVKLELPPGWTCDPASREFSLQKENEETSLEFTAGLPAGVGPDPAWITAVAEHGGRQYTEGYVTVSAPEVGRFNHYRPARHRVRVVDVKLPSDLRLGYVMGSGDEVPAALEQLGARPDLLGAAELAGKDLSGYDAVIIGVRAYAVRPDLKTSNARLLDYVKGGGVLLVQYQTPEFDENLGPFPYSMTGNPEEVSEEDAAVTILAPDHVLFRMPNAITVRDFDGWVEERGSKFLKSWDERYAPLLECRDRGQDPQRGGLLVARYGKGAYVYCAYAFYRQLPHGVPGAYRLYANLISLRRSLGD